MISFLSEQRGRSAYLSRRSSRVVEQLKDDSRVSSLKLVDDGFANSLELVDLVRQLDMKAGVKEQKGLPWRAREL
jgi:uncharacterized protein YjhX (UPF0386 family)